MRRPFWRALVPAGWMPSTEAGQWVALCSGAGETKIWVDASGHLHKEGAPAPKSPSGECAFAGLRLGFDLPHVALLIFAYARLTDLPVLLPLISRIGQGLAAPPPPKTGPPSLI